MESTNIEQPTVEQQIVEQPTVKQPTEVELFLKKCYRKSPPSVPEYHPEFTKDGEYTGIDNVIPVYMGEYVPNEFFDNNKVTCVFTAGISNLGNDLWRDKYLSHMIHVNEENKFDNYVMIIIPTPRDRAISDWKTVCSKMDGNEPRGFNPTKWEIYWFAKSSVVSFWLPCYVNKKQSGEMFGTAKSRVNTVLVESLKLSLGLGKITQDVYEDTIMELTQSNLGMMVRFELGMKLEMWYLLRNFEMVVGSPEDAIQIGAMKVYVDDFSENKIKWHKLPTTMKHELLPESFLDEIVEKIRIVQSKD